MFWGYLHSIAVGLAGAAAILMLLVLFAWFSMGPNKKNLKRDSARTEVALLDLSVKEYQKTVGSYPPNLGALLVAPADLPPGKWDGPYLNKDVPADPWGNQYQYASPGKHNPDSFDVWTVSPEGEEFCNWEMQTSRH